MAMSSLCPQDSKDSPTDQCWKSQPSDAREALRLSQKEQRNSQETAPTHGLGREAREGAKAEGGQALGSPERLRG